MSTDRTTTKEKKAKLQLQKSRVLVLTVLSGEQIGKEYLLSKKRIVIGRDPDADIAFADRLLSRRHAELAVKKGVKRNQMPDVILTDLDSTNGTFLNYEPVTKAVLKAGDKIIIGQTILKLEYKDVCD
jgi:pSer/pThr/pTyr-binding forkhead associated (FHA) protein